MFVPVWLTLLFSCTIVFRVFGAFFGRPWHSRWWQLLVLGAFAFVPYMLWADWREMMRPLPVEEQVLLAVPCLFSIACLLFVSSHAWNIHNRRAAAAASQVPDFVIDICVYPLMLSILACHSAVVMRTRGDTIDAATTLAANDIFESWALAAVLAIFQAFTKMEPVTVLCVYQFLILNAALNGAQFLIQGVAPCELCFQAFGRTCSEVAARIEEKKLADLFINVDVPYWIKLVLSHVTLVRAGLFMSSTVAFLAVVSFELRHHESLLRMGRDTKLQVFVFSWNFRQAHMKLLGVKMILWVLSFQPFCLTLALGDPGQVVFWHSFLLVIEALLLHSFHCRLAYPTADFAEGGVFASALPPPYYGAADEAGHDGGGGSATARPPPPRGSWLTWMEAVVIFLFCIAMFVGAAWLSSMFKLGSCKTTLLNGFALAPHDGHVIHSCDRATVQCGKGFAFSQDGASSFSATCGKDEHFFHDGLGVVEGCSMCSVGYVGYPSCKPCSGAEHCNGHSVNVTDDGYRKSCKCTCAQAFGGATCSECAASHIAYPDCTACSIAQHCQGHADSVTDDGGRKECKCTCSLGFAGSDCGSCAPDYVGYPHCMKCSTEGFCNGHATSASVDGSRTTCKCRCRPGYSGSHCEQCAPGYIGYPDCVKCDSQLHCNGHAVSVMDDGARSRCVCSCSAGWRGDSCSLSVARNNCTCDSTWESCQLFGHMCTSFHGCDSKAVWLGATWCKTSENCTTSSWDYC